MMVSVVLIDGSNVLKADHVSAFAFGEYLL